METNQEIPFPTDVFGQADNPAHPVAQFQREVVEVEGAPPEFVVPALLAALSAAGGRGLEVESFKGKRSRSNLYIATEGESGVGKSAVGKRVFGPLFDHDCECRQRYRETVLPSLTAEIRMLEGKLKRAEKMDNLIKHEFSRLVQEKIALEGKLVGPRSLVDDCTQEALEQIISQQDGVVSLISTDARKVVKNLLGRHRNGSVEDDIFIKGWSGDTYSVDRITRGSIPPVREACLSMYVAVQPDLFRHLAKPALIESGFFPRLLPGRSCDGFKIDISTREYNQTVVSRYSEHIRGAFNFYRGVQRPLQFAMSPEARSVMDSFFVEAANLAAGDPTLASIYRRWAEQACRIAVCIQIGFFSQQAHMQPLHGYCARKAVELMRWFGQQQCELLQDYADNARNDLAGRLFDLVQQQPDGISLRKAWKKLGSSSGAVKAIIAADSRLELTNLHSTGGRPPGVIFMKHATPCL